MLNEAELIGNAIESGTYLRPRRTTWKQWVEFVIVFAALAFIVYGIAVTAIN